MPNVIEVQDLRKNYNLRRKGGQFEAVKGISFSVEKGEIFGILGPNGAGKTTTLEIIEAINKQTSGVVKVLGLDNLAESQKIKRKIGVQLQSSSYLPNLTLMELLELFQSLYGKHVSGIMNHESWRNQNANIKNQNDNLKFKISEPQSVVEIDNSFNPLTREPVNLHSTAGNLIRLLQFVGLEDKKDEYVKNLSGGQKQRFTLATTLVHRPEIIFLDEPTTGLDPRARREVWQLIRNINSQGVTVVLTTHYMEEAEFLCNRVAIMDHGEILKIDEPKKLINDLAHTTQVSFLVESQFPENIFQPLALQIEKIYSNYPKVILEIKSLDIVGKVVEILKNHNISFSGFTVRTASLEDVYLDLTGREYSDL